MIDLAWGGNVRRPGARQCPHGGHQMSDAFIMKHCSAPPVSSWKQTTMVIYIVHVQIVIAKTLSYSYVLMNHGPN